MKRIMPTSLVTFLQNNQNSHKADCFLILLPTGQTLLATEGQWDITFLETTPGWTGPPTTFKATQYGVWNRGKITAEAGTNCNSNTMDLTCTPQLGTTYPGLSIGILEASRNHLFDGAIVWVYTAYMPIGGYGDVSAGIETKFQGTITKIPKQSRNLVQFQCADPFYLLNMKVPSRLYQSNCPWQFCDSNCTLSTTNYTDSLIAASGSTQTTITPTTSLGQSDGYFAQGVVKCISGANAGLSQTVKSYVGGVFTLMVPWILPVVAGDVFSAIKGCDKTIQTCKTTKQVNGTVVDNSLFFGGTPFVPAPSASV